MLTVFRYEWRRLTGRVSAVVSASILALLSGILCTVFHLALASAYTAYTLRLLALPMALLITIPILLRTRQEEQASQIRLSSLPLSRGAIFFGRYLSDLLLLLAASVVLILMPLLLSMFGEIDFAESYLALGAYLLLGALLLAAAEAVNALFERTWVRFAVLYGGIVLFFAVYSVLPTLDLPHLLEALLEGIDPFSAFDAMTYGELVPSALLTLLAFLVAALYIGYTDGALRRVKKSTSGIALACALAVGLGSSFLPFSLELVKEETFVVSGVTKDALRALDEDVNVYYLVEGGKSEADSDLYGFLQKYAAESAHIKLSVIDTARETAFHTAYIKTAPREHSIVVESQKRHYVVDSSSYYHYYNSELEQNFSSDYYLMCLSAYEYYATNGSYGDYDATTVKYGSTLYYSTGTTAYFDGDALLCNAIRYVTSPDVPTLYFHGLEQNSAAERLSSYLASNGYFIRELSELSVIPEDCALLFLNSPREDLSESEVAALERYLADDGRLFLATSCASVELPRLLAVLDDYGMGVLDDSNIVCELLSSEGDYAENFYASVATAAAATGDFDGQFVLMVPHAISLTETEGVKHTDWVFTTRNACLKYSATDPDPETAARYTCGAIAEKGDSRVLWLSSALAFDLQAYVYSDGGNYRLLLSALDWATETAYTHITVSSSPIKSTVLGISSGELSLWGIVVATVIPLCTILPLSVRLYVRKKK